MSGTAADAVRSGRRRGRPFLFSIRETLVFFLVGVALVGSAAVPVVTRHPGRIVPSALVKLSQGTRMAGR